MNRIFRLVFNRALGVVQAVPEFATGHTGGSTKPAVGLTLRAAALALGIATALATTGAHAADTLGNGGSSGTAGRGGPGSSQGGGMGGYAYGNYTIAAPVTGGDGGVGGTGSTGVGGTGGLSATYDTSTGQINGSSSTGNAGGAGTQSSGGGGGGSGYYINPGSAGSTFTLLAGATATGGAGGAGGATGGGGGGGSGIVAGPYASILLQGTAVGGMGGLAGDSSDAGGGGAGVSLLGNASLDVTGSALGATRNLAATSSDPGEAGVGIVAYNGNNHISVHGNVSGGYITADNIGDAILLFGGNNTLDIYAGSTISGAIVSSYQQNDTLTFHGNGTSSSIIGEIPTISTDGSGMQWTHSGEIFGENGTGMALTFNILASDTLNVSYLEAGDNIGLPGDDEGGLVKNGAGTLDATHLTVSTLTMNDGGLSFHNFISDATFVINGGTVDANQNTVYLYGLRGTGGSFINASTLNLDLFGYQQPDNDYAGVLKVGTLNLEYGALTLTGDTTVTSAVVSSDASLSIGDGGTTGTLTGNISGTGVTFNRSDAATYAGNASTTDLTQAGSGKLTLSGSNSTNTLTVANGTLSAASANALGNATVNLANGTTFDFGGSYAYANTLQGTGNMLLNAGSGITGGLTGSVQSTMSGALLTKTGAGRVDVDGALGVNALVNGGSLVIGSTENSAGTATQGIHAADGSTLGGFGSVTGGVTVTDSTLSPGMGQIGTLTVDSLDMSNGHLAIDAGTAGTSDLLNVTGNASFVSSVVDVTNIGGMGAGIYRFLTVGGNSTGEGLALGSTPDGEVLSLKYLSDEKAYDLVDSTGVLLNYWNADGLASATHAGGGSGTWSVTSPVFSNADGSVTSALAPQPGFAIFTGAAGTVTVDGGAGDVTATGMQFATDGYHLKGDTLTLVANNGDAPIIRVGDGTTAGAATTATIDNVLTGTAGLTKTDAGTLVLNGDNTYQGGTWLNGGTLAGTTSTAFGTGDITMAEGTTLGLWGNGTTVANRIIVAGDPTIDVADGSSNTLSGAIVDGTSAGDIVKTGNGTLRLTAANTYTGGTTVSAGTLIVGNGATSGSIVGNVAVGSAGTLAFDRSDDVTFAGTLSGAGNVQKLGTNTLTLTGDSSGFTGTTSVAGGVLDLAGSLGGALVLSESAVLTGNGSLGGLTVASGTTVTPGGDAAIGTINVAGNLVFAAGSAYVVNTSAEGDSDTLTATGTATLGNAAVRSLQANGTYKANTRYTILTANGGVDGTFGTVSSNLAFLTPSLSYDSTHAYLTLARNDVSFASLAQNPNQVAVANAVQSQGEGKAVYDAVVSLQAPVVPTALGQLAGESLASARTALVDDARQIRDTVQRHVLTTDGDGAWASAWGHWGDRGGSAGVDRLRSNGGGVMFGADRNLGSFTLGGTVGTGDVTARSGSDSVQGNSRVAGLYMAAETGAWQWQAGAMYGWNRLDSHRTVAVTGLEGRTSARYDANVAQAYVDGGYKFTFSHGSLTPFVDVARVQVDQDGIHERNSDAALDVQSQNDGVTLGAAGLRGSLQIGEGLSAHATLGYQQAWGDVRPTSTQRFVTGGDSFTVSGAPVARHAGLADAGLTFAVARNTTVDASYHGLFGGGAKDQGARLGVTVKW
jgi:autotransporter-associated beta strand protein